MVLFKKNIKPVQFRQIVQSDIEFKYVLEFYIN